ncbi:gliding motility protein GldM [Rasiella rasia]|uniref:Gliding motility protein GldM n=1 Tax=Rasiella rasia TaxID=2744027 RepID=A0A6G6GLJ5_9FLAO|nr:gliding motility protein GldM [Rasiella rasia]QIE59360.1 gliding motility protein GldM [Rasiella rasia]
MAGGKLSPRQKMINLMYLVFIAMLALNMSKEVLSAFGLLNNKIEKANTETANRNTAFMEGLNTKASDEPAQYAAVYAKAQEIEATSNELDSYLTSLKSAAIKDLEDPTDYEVMDKPDHFNNLFFTGDNYKPEGEEFIAKMNKYRTEMLAILSDTAVAKKVAGVEDLKKSLESNFSTSPETNRDGKEIEWLKYNYEGFPLIASMTKLTQLQADVKTAKSEVLSKMLSGQQAAALSFSNYSTIMEASKSAFYSGEVFEGSIMLGRTDASTVPKRVELTLDGRPLTESQYTVEGGRVKLNIGAGSPGDHKIEGMLVYGEGGEEIEVPVKSSFATINKPDKATISADKMNVVYRGVANPMTIAFDGAQTVSASATGLTRNSGSSYTMRPGAGREVTINVSATLPGGEKRSDSQKFRIKDIPPPQGAIRGETGIVRMQRNGLEISSVSAVLPDFDFDVKLNVTGFSFKVSGQPTVRVNGTRLDGAAKGALRRAKRGDAVQIFDINAKVQGSSVVLKKTSPVIIELTN